MKKLIAFVTGITGQDGSYLAEFLLAKGYTVHGLVRCSSTINTSRIAHLCKSELMNHRFFLHKGDLADFSSLKSLVDKIRPDEIYNLGAMSHVKTSFEIPEYTANVDALGVLRLLEIIRLYHPDTKLYQASTSELYGKVREIPQSETTPFHPRSPYGVAKLYAYWAIVNYREAYNLFATNGILFNHESPRRGELFVTRKITRGIARILLGLQDKLVLGNLDAKRDWGYAKDYVEGMWLMLQQREPEDFVLATGETHSVREFLEFAFSEVGIEIEWVGKGVEEKGIDSKTGKVLVEISPEFFRPAEVDLLIGDPSKARNRLGWTATTSFKELASLMVRSDVEEEERALGLTTTGLA